jgi:hypothetical protein
MSRVVHFEINSDNPQRALSLNNAFGIIEMDEKVTV